MFVTINGQRMTVAKAAATVGINPQTVRGRLRRGINGEAALAPAEIIRTRVASRPFAEQVLLPPSRLDKAPNIDVHLKFWNMAVFPTLHGLPPRGVVR